MSGAAALEPLRHAPVSLARQLLRQSLLVAATIVTLYPILWVVKIALSPDTAFASGLSPFPSDLTLQHVWTLFGRRDDLGQLLFPIQLFNSLAVSIATTVVGVSVAITAAWAFSRFSFPGQHGLMQGLLITQMFPGVVMAVPLYLLLDAIGLLDSLSGLVIVYATTSVPFSVWMLKGYFDTIPRDLEDAARVDGASTATIFFRIILPLSKPAIVVTSLFSFMTAWNEFILAATFLDAERRQTLPVVLQSFVDNTSTDWGPFAAGAVVVSVPVMALFFFLQKHLVGGLTAGAVKG